MAPPWPRPESSRPAPGGRTEGADLTLSLWELIAPFVRGERAMVRSVGFTSMT